MVIKFKEEDQKMKDEELLLHSLTLSENPAVQYDHSCRNHKLVSDNTEWIITFQKQVLSKYLVVLAVK